MYILLSAWPPQSVSGGLGQRAPGHVSGVFLRQEVAQTIAVGDGANDGRRPRAAEGWNLPALPRMKRRSVLGRGE